MTPVGRLALALLFVELIAGTQMFMQATIAPLIADDLDGHAVFGLIYSAVLASSFLTLPWGPRLIDRYGIPRLMLGLTAVNAIGAVTSAVAPTIWVFVLGRVIAGLSVGVMATASMGAVVRHLPSNWRKLVLATYSGTYIISSLVGPAYAAVVSHALGWRVSMVLYLPLLIAARIVISRNITESESHKHSNQTLPVGLGVLMAMAAFGISASSAVFGQYAPVAILIGMVLIAFSAIRLLPAGTFSLRRGRPRATLVFFTLTGSYFAVDSVISIIAYDTLGLSTLIVGLILSAGGLGWAIFGFICGRRPTTTSVAYGKRSLLGGALMIAGVVMLAVAIQVPSSVAMWLMLVGWTTSSIGMGLFYLDTMNIIFTPPTEGDGIDDLGAASAVAFSEQISAILIATPFASVVGLLVSLQRTDIISALMILMAALFLAVVVLSRGATGSLDTASES